MSVQAMHAAIQFQYEHAEYAKLWYKQSNYLGFLSVDNEVQLLELIEQARLNDIKYSIFSEPDIDNQITAIALAPGLKTKKMVSKLKLALKE
jgi:hypothetical protein